MSPWDTCPKLLLSPPFVSTENRPPGLRPNLRCTEAQFDPMMSQRSLPTVAVNNRTPAPPTRLPGSSAAGPVANPALPLRLWIALIALIFLTAPLTYTVGLASPWFAPAGIAFAYVAWFGPRAASAVLLGGALAVGVAWLRGFFADTQALILAWIDVPFVAAEALLAWEIYRRARGARTGRSAAPPSYFCCWYRVPPQ